MVARNAFRPKIGYITVEKRVGICRFVGIKHACKKFVKRLALRLDRQKRSVRPSDRDIALAFALGLSAGDKKGRFSAVGIAPSRSFYNN